MFKEMMTKEGSTKIINFITLRAGVLVLGRGRISHKVKMHFYFENLLLYTQWVGIVMVIKKESSKIVNFTIPVVRVLVFGYDHKIKMQYFFSSCQHWGMDQTN